MAARDAGPGEAFRLIADTLSASGHTVQAFLGMGKPFPTEALQEMSVALRDADVLLVGIASIEEQATEELIACEEARKLGVRIAVFSDIYGAYHRAWHNEVLMSADVLFVIDEQETDTARNYVRGKTQIIASGNPYWTSFFDNQTTREEVRSKLGIHNEEKMLMLVGNKEMERNMLLLNEVVFATNGMDEKFHIVITQHPGDAYPKDICKGITRWAEHPVQFTGRDCGFKSQQIITGSDTVITSGGSSVGIMAACQRKPVIDVMHSLDDVWWKELSGLNFWPPARQGSSRVVWSTELLHEALKSLQGDTAYIAYMARAQEEAFSLSKFDGALDKIVTSITG